MDQNKTTPERQASGSRRRLKKEGEGRWIIAGIVGIGGALFSWEIPGVADKAWLLCLIFAALFTFGLFFGETILAVVWGHNPNNRTPNRKRR